jgi:hypothetical protein
MKKSKKIIISLLLIERYCNFEKRHFIINKFNAKTIFLNYCAFVKEVLWTLILCHSTILMIH